MFTRIRSFFRRQPPIIRSVYIDGTLYFFESGELCMISGGKRSVCEPEHIASNGVKTCQIIYALGLIENYISIDQINIINPASRGIGVN